MSKDTAKHWNNIYAIKMNSIAVSSMPFKMRLTIQFPWNSNVI